MSPAERMAARARSLIGVRFRPQGRDPETGLDCVGAAAAAAGLPPHRIRRDYALRGAALAEIEHELCDLGLLPVRSKDAQAGDVVVMEAGPAQLHLAVFTGTGFVHADAAIGRVVERPGPAPWPVLATWRLNGGE
jgi:murein DD-endopeptidase / murein LD-carboxypeptidase